MWFLLCDDCDCDDCDDNCDNCDDCDGGGGGDCETVVLFDDSSVLSSSLLNVWFCTRGDIVVDGNVSGGSFRVIVTGMDNNFPPPLSVPGCCCCVDDVDGDGDLFMATSFSIFFCLYYYLYSSYFIVL